MKNTEKLKELGILGDLRQRMGADNPEDESKDIIVNKMINNEIVKEWACWHLGNGTWWTTMKHYFDALERMDKKSVK